jgi:hypothetical protein
MGVNGSHAQAIAAFWFVAEGLLACEPKQVVSWERFGHMVANVTPTRLLFQRKAVRRICQIMRALQRKLDVNATCRNEHAAG